MEPEDQTARRGLHFDPTINAGHLLTFAAMAVSLFIGWSSIDKRVVVLEEAKAYQAKRDDAQDATINEKLVEIKEAIKDVKHGVEELRRDQKAKP